MLEHMDINHVCDSWCLGVLSNNPNIQKHYFSRENTALLSQAIYEQTNIAKSQMSQTIL